jgi:hypothetical protein
MDWLLHEGISISWWNFVTEGRKIAKYMIRKIEFRTAE